MNYLTYFMRAAKNVMPAILLHWPTVSEADVGGMAVEAEPSHQYSDTCCCRVTDGSRGSLTEWCLTWSAYGAKVVSPSSSMQEKMSPIDIHRWRPSSGCEHSEVTGGAFQQW